jgi:class 3 adenylate cyclase
VTIGAGSGRSTAIVLFTDLVGSTALRSRLGEHAAEKLRRTHDQLIGDAIEANRGRWVKNLGDGVMATFTGASDAVAAAVAIQQALTRQSRSGSGAVPIEVRIGVSAGDVTTEEGDCFGTPVIEAARLCGAAQGGQVLVSEIVRWLTGGGGPEFISVGSLELKGLPSPVAACQVAWEPLPQSSIPLPTMLTDIGRVFVGRERELERLDQLWREADAGELRVALLRGEPGVGKTRLAAELARGIHEQGATVLSGRCDEGLGVPYQPFVEALRHFLDHAPQRELAKHLGRYAGELTRLLPDLAERVPDLPPPLHSDPETERYRLFDAVAAWLTALSREQPLLLVLDDLQWAAKPTLLLLRHVAHREQSRIMLLGTYRDTELAHDHPLIEVLADLRRQAEGARLSLSGLDRAGVTAFMEQVAGHTLDEEDVALARAIHDETEGNPFFVREVLRHLTETGAIERRDGRWTTRLRVEDVGIPEGVREVIGRRLARLSGDANKALRVAAVVGTGFELPVVQAAGRLSDDVLLAVLDEATDARLVIEAPGARYRFAHALVRDTLYEGLSSARRVALHASVAEAIEMVHVGDLDDHLPALARHWARASAPAAGTARAIDYAARAGDRALAQLAPDEAAAYYQQALELLQVADGPVDESRRLALLISLGEAQRRAGDPAHREALLDAARLAERRGDAEAQARAALANIRETMYVKVGEVDEERVTALERALEAAGTDSPWRARLLAALGQELTWAARDRRVQLSDEALALARRQGEPAALAEVLLARYYAIVSPETHEERRANTAELLGLAEQLGDASIHSRALALRFRVAIEAGDVAEADRCLQNNERLTADLHQPTLRWFVALQRAGRSLFSGRLAEAEGFVLDARRVGDDAGQPDAWALHLWQQFSVRFEQGRLDELVGELRRMAEAIPGLPACRVLVALAHAELDQADEARAAFRGLAESEFAGLPVDTIWLRAATDSAAVCAHLGEAGWAGVLYQQLAPYAAQFPTACLGTPTGSVAYHLGLLATTLARFDDAATHFAAAEAAHARVGAPTWLARTRLERARMLLTRCRPGDVDGARELLGQALTTARELGLGNVERHAVALLGRSAAPA